MSTRSHIQQFDNRRFRQGRDSRRNFSAVSLVCLSVAIFGAALTEARAENPSFRYCEAGWNYESVDAGFAFQPIPALDGGVETDNGGGFRVACVAEITSGIFLHGEYREADVDLKVDLRLDDEFAADVFNMDTTSWRIGAGYALDLPYRVSVYGAAAFARTEFDPEDFVTILPSGAAQLQLDDASVKESGFDLEAGARWLVTERVELGGFVRYADNGALRFPETGPLNLLRTDEDWRGGVSAAFNVTGPAWISTRYEFGGDVDALFAGLRLAL